MHPSLSQPHLNPDPGGHPTPAPKTSPPGRQDRQAFQRACIECQLRAPRLQYRIEHSSVSALKEHWDE